MSLKRHNLIREKVAITSLILTGRLTRSLPIIRGTTESPATSPLPISAHHTQLVVWLKSPLQESASVRQYPKY